MAAQDGHLVTFGIVPRAPETGYGYIRRGAELPGGELAHCPFCRKARRAMWPSSSLRSGDYYWNSGMFLFRARRYLEELRRHAPDIAERLRAGLRSAPSAISISTRVDASAFDRLPELTRSTMR